MAPSDQIMEIGVRTRFSRITARKVKLPLYFVAGTFFSPGCNRMSSTRAISS